MKAPHPTQVFYEEEHQKYGYVVDTLCKYTTVCNIIHSELVISAMTIVVMGNVMEVLLKGKHTAFCEVVFIDIFTRKLGNFLQMTLQCHFEFFIFICNLFI